MNAQVAMDAPFAGEVADEAVRAKGRSEEQFKGYSGYAEMLQDLMVGRVDALLERQAR